MPYSRSRSSPMSSGSTWSPSRTTRTRRASSIPGRCSRSSRRRPPTCGSPRTSRTCRCARRWCSRAASRRLDLLSGGRVELGLGAGAFWDAIVAVGGPLRTPGQAVDALAEAIDVIRAAWNAGGGAIRHEGEHYQVVGAHPGPAPAHDVEIWLGAYKPRMLGLTGTKADGWLPSMGYADLADLPAMNAAIDRAAEAAGRRPAAVRRLFNVNGAFGSGGGFLQGDRGLGRAARRAHAGHRDERVHPLGVLRGRRPAVRRGGRARGARAGDRRARGAGEPAPAPAAARPPPPTAPLAAAPTPDDGTRLSDERPWDETTRPAGPGPDPVAVHARPAGGGPASDRRARQPAARADRAARPRSPRSRRARARPPRRARSSTA